MDPVPEDEEVVDHEVPDLETGQQLRPHFDRPSVIGTGGSWHVFNRLVKDSLGFRSHTNVMLDTSAPMEARLAALKALEERVASDPTRRLMKDALRRKRERVAGQRTASFVDDLGTESLIFSERLFDWFTPRRTRHIVFWTPLITLVCLLVFAFMAGAFGPSGPSGMLSWVVHHTFDAPYLVTWGARYAPDLRRRPWQWFTSALVHRNSVHILSNLALFLLLGYEVEARYGVVRFIALWLLTTWAGALLSSVAENPCIPVVGLSGSVFGLMGVFIMDLFKYWQTLTAPMLRLIAFVFLLLVLVVSFIAQPGNTSHASHGGGFVMGLLLALLFQKHVLQPRPWLAPSTVEHIEAAIPGLVAFVAFSYYLALCLGFYLGRFPHLACPALGA